MCGIFVVWSKNFNSSDVSRALHQMSHRGPDSQGIWSSAVQPVIIGHARLSIIDLISGQQPLVNEDDSVIAAVHGEFYNYKKIRLTLINEGHIFKSNSDSEILIHLYEKYGVNAIDHLEGEFAFALWDEKKQFLWVVRDRFGTKPLHIYERQGVLAISTELSAFSAIGLPLTWSATSIYQSLILPAVGSCNLIQEVDLVPPGTYLTFTRNGKITTKYWKPELEENPPTQIGELIKSSKVLFYAAVEKRLQADVPIACYLSGGLDSSAIYTVATELQGKPLPSFVVRFQNGVNDDEVQRASILAGKNLEILDVSNQKISDNFEDAVTFSENIILNGHAPARFLLSQLVKERGYRVVLGGEGADELFGGYWFMNPAIKESTKMMTKIAHFFLPPYNSAVWKFSPTLWAISRVIRFPQEISLGITKQSNILNQIFLSEFFKQNRRKDPILSLLNEISYWQDLRSKTAARQVVGIWLRTIFSRYNLAAEKLDMANAVELRLPFLDHHLWEHLASQPTINFMDGKKNLLKKIVSDSLPKVILQAEKKPFLAPMMCLQDPLFQHCADIINSSQVDDLPGLNLSIVLKLIDQCRQNRILPLEVQSILLGVTSLLILKRKLKFNYV